MKLKRENYTIKQPGEQKEILRRLYPIFKATLCPDMQYRFFAGFYLASNPHLIQVTFLVHEGKDVGFFTCSYAFQELQNRKTVICRVAIGLLEQYQGGAMPFTALCRRIISYKIQKPLLPVYLVAYLANPLVYASIARYTAQYWPNRFGDAPPHIVNLKNSILTASKLDKKEISPFVLKLHFHVYLPASLLERIRQSKNPDVKYYLQINPHPENQLGVMTIVPIRWWNIISNTWKAMVVRPLSKLKIKITNWFSLSDLLDIFQ